MDKAAAMDNLHQAGIRMVVEHCECFEYFDLENYNCSRQGLLIERTPPLNPPRR